MIRMKSLAESNLYHTAFMFDTLVPKKVSLHGNGFATFTITLIVLEHLENHIMFLNSLFLHCPMVG